jgi:hypothetical protein
MAPEVLTAQDYNQSADVYSYGIVLWEMLTRQRPFVGLKPMQIMLKVVKNDYRPIIPSNCPSKLADMIRQCWGRDPKLRPSFSVIREAFMKGLAFPGADPERVQTYITQFLTRRGDVKSFNPQDANMISAKALAKELHDEATRDSAISKLKITVDNPNWIPFLCEDDLISVIIDIISGCTKPELVPDLVPVISTLLSSTTGLNKLLAKGGIAPILNMFWRFATTSTKSVIESLQIILNAKAVVFKADDFTKLTPFLVANDLGLRVAATNLVLSAIEDQAFDDFSALTVLAGSVLTNIIPEANEELLKASLDLLGKLVAGNTIFDKRTAATVFAITARPGRSFKLQSLRIVRQLLSVPDDDTVEQILPQLQSLFKIEDPELDRETLKLLAVLLRCPSAFEKAAVPGTFKAFQRLLRTQDPDVLALALRLCYAFLSDADSFFVFADLRPALIGILSSQIEAAVQLGAACLTAIIQRSAVSVSSEPKVTQFLLRSFASQTQALLVAGLRLAGVIASSIAGAKFLDDAKVVSAVAPLLGHANKTVRRFALMVFAQVSASWPICKSALEAMPVLLGLLNDDLESFPQIAAANFVVNPRAAEQSARQFPALVAQLAAKEPMNRGLALTAIHRVVRTPEATPHLNDLMTIQKLIALTEPYWEKDSAQVVFEIIDAITAMPAGRQLDIMPNVTGFVRKRLLTMKPCDPKRPILVRIFLRVSAG